MNLIPFRRHLPVVPAHISDETISSWMARTGHYYGIGGWRFITALSKEIGQTGRKRYSPGHSRGVWFDDTHNLSCLINRESDLLANVTGTESAALAAASLNSSNSRYDGAYFRPDNQAPYVCQKCLGDMIDDHGFVYEKREWRNSTSLSCAKHAVSLTRSINFYEYCGVDSSRANLRFKTSFDFMERILTTLEKDPPEDRGSELAAGILRDRQFSGPYLERWAVAHKTDPERFATLLMDLLILSSVTTNTFGTRWLTFESLSCSRTERLEIFNCSISFDAKNMAKILFRVSLCMFGKLSHSEDLFIDLLRVTTWYQSKFYRMDIGSTDRMQIESKIRQRLKLVELSISDMATDWPHEWRRQFQRVLLNARARFFMATINCSRN